MKKFLSFFLSFFLVLSMTACESDSGSDEGPNTNPNPGGNLSSENTMSIFSFKDIQGQDINISQATKTIAVIVPNGTDVTALVATFIVSAKATVKVGETVQESGVTANDFTSPVTYTVVAEDGTTQNYTVTVTVAGGGTTGFTVDFEDLSLSNNSHWQGPDDPGTSSFTSGEVVFEITKGAYTFYGLTYSNRTDGSNFTGFTAAKPGSGHESTYYGIAYLDDGTSSTVGNIIFSDGQGHSPTSMYITNTIDGYTIMHDGDAFNGGPLAEGKSFKVLIKGYSDAEGTTQTGETVEVTLGEFPSGGTLSVVDSWTLVDLTPLGSGVKKITFEGVTTQTNDNGFGGTITVPLVQFAFDDIVFSE